MKKIKQLLILVLFTAPFFGFCQYTDVINSNRPGLSVSAYAVGRNVFQIEFGGLYEQQDHNQLNTESNILGADFSLRYGLLFEALELNWEGTFQNQNITFTNLGTEDSRTDFSRNRIGLKFLVYDPFKNPEANKPNLYSWRANNLFQLKNLIPAVSVYAGANIVLGDNPFYVGDPTISPRVMVATQSRLTPKFVLISNIAYDRIGTDFPEWSYLISLSHAFRNPKWSVFVENQGVKSDRYSDILLRSGVAHLISEKLQVDLNLGANFKNSPSRIFVSSGFSYRFDMHKDDPIAIEDQKGGAGGPIKKNSMKKEKKAAKKAKKKNKGRGAEDIDLGPSKKQLRKLKKKKKGKDDGVIDF
ncbi:transporter [Spongiimicrobium sp. 3-5]|uniref:transporter n=1 Tax=Spongiimicrobium sp. 3-5 TaxID=3332596 RepID=UPI003980E098